MFRKNALPILQKIETRKNPETDESGPTWWRSLDELADTEEFRQYLQREFPENASEWLAGSRRDFLRLMGASLFLAGLSGCDIKQPMEKIVPSVNSTGQSKPGLPMYFTTAMDFAGSAIGLTVQSRDGRPIKIEGNANHPASLGATGIFAQAATLDLYDPDRARTPLHKGLAVSLKQLHQELAAMRRELDQTKGEGLRLLIGTSTSPTLARLLDHISQRWPKSKWAVYESVNDDAVRAGMALAYGEAAATRQPIYDFSQASVVLSVDCDFLAARDLPPCYIRQFADARRIAGKETGDAKNAGRSMVRLYHLGSTPTPTSAKADHPLAVTPSKLGPILKEVAVRLGVDLGEKFASPNEKPVDNDHASGWLDNLVDDLKRDGQRSLVVVGRDQPPANHALAHAINEHLKAVGRTVQFIPSPQVRPKSSPSDIDMLSELTAEMHTGKVNQLLILGGNPAFDAPSDIAFRQGMAKVESTLTLAAAANETSAESQWLVPLSHFLEGWGDARAHDGTASIIQPLISPLYDSLTVIELLASLVEGNPSGYAAVRATWGHKFGSSDDNPKWQQAVADGVIDETGAKPVELSLSLDRIEKKLPTPKGHATDHFDIAFKPDPTVWDGRFLNNGWLQELPKPLSQVLWDNTAWIATADAKRLQLKNGDVVTIGQGKQAVDVPVWIVPGHAEGALTVFAGYGRNRVGRVGKNTGVDVQPLRTKNAFTIRRNVPLAKTDRQQTVVTTQHFQVMEGRHIARAGSLAEYEKHSDHPPFAHPPSPAPDVSFYDEWPYENTNKWGMTIDLTACVGCSACVIACQAENNIPVVGKEQCDMNRHMHWIRVDTYYQGSPEQPDRTLNQPVPCMQCENAPCEVVCPVAATNHSDDGLNQMIYNRCVGTRYCSNNCPYKVRRFNFLDFSDNFITDPSLHLLSNPEVTMRSRGVMEKCSYCIQRIEQGRIGAQLEDREIRDGEIKTACQAVCPAEAIRFGDLNDEKSHVRSTADHPLNYVLLEDLNTKPRTTYLAEVFNPANDKSSEDREVQG